MNYITTSPPTVDPVLDCLSLPARSTRLSLPTLMCSLPSGPICKLKKSTRQKMLAGNSIATSLSYWLTAQHSTVTMKMAWEREECSFISVLLYIHVCSCMVKKEAHQWSVGLTLLICFDCLGPSLLLSLLHSLSKLMKVPTKYTCICMPYVCIQNT